MSDLAAAQKLAERALMVRDYGDEPELDDHDALARALLSALDALGEIERRANIIIENGGQPSPEAFAYLANLRDAYVAQIKALEAKNRAALDALEAANKERDELAKAARKARAWTGRFATGVSKSGHWVGADAVVEALDAALASVAEPQKDTA